MYDLRKTPKKEYFKLRGKARKHSSISSGVLSASRRHFFGNHDKKFIVGGIILEKEIEHRCHYAHEINRWRYFPIKELNTNQNRRKSVDYVSTLARFTLWDFSGIVVVNFLEVSSGVYIDFSGVKEGDTVYVISKNVTPSSAFERFTINGDAILSEDDMIQFEKGDFLYSGDDPAREFYKREELEGIKKEGSGEDIWFISEWTRDPWPVVQYFLKKETGFDEFDYYLLINTLYYNLYKKYLTEKIAKMIVKYYNIWSSTQNWYEEEGVTPKKWFYDWFQDLRGVIPESHIQRNGNFCDIKELRGQK